MGAFREKERRAFWRLSNMLQEAKRAGDAIEANEILDEIGGMLICTDDPMLRQRCRSLLEQHEPTTRFAAG